MPAGVLPSCVDWPAHLTKGASWEVAQKRFSTITLIGLKTLFSRRSCAVLVAQGVALKTWTVSVYAESAYSSSGALLGCAAAARRAVIAARTASMPLSCCIVASASVVYGPQTKPRPRGRATPWYLRPCSFSGSDPPLSEYPALAEQQHIRT